MKMSKAKTSTKKKATEELKVWNHKVKTEEEKEIIVKDITFNAKFYKTTEGIEGIRVPLENNGEIWEKFHAYCKGLEDKLSEREKKYDLIQFSTFAEADREGLGFFPMIGFYYLNGHLVFHTEPESPKPLIRLTKFVEYYKSKFNIKVKPKKDLFQVLEGLELTD